MSAVPTYLEKVESYLVDEFLHGLHRIMLETLWSDVRAGAWIDDLKFFQCLDSEYNYLLINRNKPLQVEMHLRDLNFSGREGVNGPSAQFLESRLPRNRQTILLLHSLRLMLEHRENSRSDILMLTGSIRREIHQCLRLIFFHFKGDSDTHRLQDFIDQLDQFEWLEMRQVQLLLADYQTSWLERQGITRTEVDDLNKLRSFFLTLTKWVTYHPRQTPGEPVQFEYGYVFQDWQKVGFLSSLHYEVDRLTSLIYLEGLSHSQGFTYDVLTGVADRASFEAEINRWITRSKTEGRSFAFAMLDVDDFKAINGAHGHLGGDFVLKSVSDLLKSNLGPNDFIARWGDKGDEFVVLIRDALTEAERRLNACTMSVANAKLEYQVDGENRLIKVTVSCGLAECAVGDHKDDLIRKANQAMYIAKNNGKNRLVASRLSGGQSIKSLE